MVKPGTSLINNSKDRIYNHHRPPSTRPKLASMDQWCWILSLFLPIVLFSFAWKLPLFSSRARKLPPGPLSIPFLNPLLWLCRNLFDNVETILRDLHEKHGPIITLYFISKPAIFIADRTLAHDALVRHGVVFCSRVPGPSPNRVISTDPHHTCSAPYGPLWRVLRRNLASEFLHPSRVKRFAGARRRALAKLLDSLATESDNDGAVVANGSFQFTITSLLVRMCFGEQVGDDGVREIQGVMGMLHEKITQFLVFTAFPSITKLVFRGRWRLLQDIRRRMRETFVPLIEERAVCSYVDSLAELTNPEQGGRKLTEEETVVLCTEYFSAGIDATATALEWIMAELVIHPEIQNKLWEEIIKTTTPGDNIEEEDLAKMPYLRAVVLEGLRRHPPVHFVVPHAVTEEVEIGGYVVPKDASVNFMLADYGWDERVWSEPMEFRPERFMAGGEAEGYDITGSREIKMMPFGAGRRMCPGYGLAMLHLEYFVANLVREFEWKAVEGEEVDLSEKLEFAVVMKNHFRARLVRRQGNNGIM